MTDTSKYKNITVTHKTYDDLDVLRDKILDPNFIFDTNVYLSLNSSKY